MSQVELGEGLNSNEREPGARFESHRQLIDFCLDPVRHPAGMDHIEHDPHFALVDTHPNLPYEGVVQQHRFFHLAGSDPKEIDHHPGRSERWRAS